MPTAGHIAMAAQCITVSAIFHVPFTSSFTLTAIIHIIICTVGELKIKENSVLDLAFGRTISLRKLNFIEAHSCLQANTDGKLMSRHTTVMHM